MMSDDFAILATRNGMVRFDLSVGNIAQLDLVSRGNKISPLHRAHWVDDPRTKFPDNMPKVDRRLSGDFFCAPFGALGSTELPFHGHPANSAWKIKDQGAKAIFLELMTPVQGAKIEKLVALGPGPLLYQTHFMIGGEGTLPVSTHPMFKVDEGDQIFHSPKSGISTPSAPIVNEAHLLQYPAQAKALDALPGTNGDLDLSRYPAKTKTEDFVQMVEAEHPGLAWTAILRADQVVFVLKDPKFLPVTQLWFSNGGRIDAPWDGKHTNVLGVEDACVPAPGQSAAGISLSPDSVQVVRHVIGAVARPEGWDAITDIQSNGDELTLLGQGEQVMRLPFDEKYFEKI